MASHRAALRIVFSFPMTVEMTYPHIEKVESNPARLKWLLRTRVVQIAVDYLNHGWSADEIVLHYPHLKQAEVHSALAYYFDHQAEIDGEIDEEQRLISETRKKAQPIPGELRLRAEGLLLPRCWGATSYCAAPGWPCTTILRLVYSPPRSTSMLAGRRSAM